MKRPKRLSATFVNVPGRYGDGRGGHGLSLLVKPATHGGFSNSLAQRIRLDGKAANVGLGAYPVVTLAHARQMALANARIVCEGRAPSFEQAVEIVIEIHAENWKDGGKSAAQWRASLRDYAVPKIGSKRVDRMTIADVMEVLLPIWSTKRETARRVRQRIDAVMKWAVAQGYREDNPAGDAISAALRKNSVRRQHQNALPHAQVGEALARVRASRAHRATALAFEFLVVTACRSGEVRGARWDEVDEAAATWTVPPARMKAKLEHRVPLSGHAVAVLDEAREIADRSGLVFPSFTGRVLSDSTLSKLLRELGIGAVPHGFRSRFRDRGAERTDVPREVCELALAHVNTDRVEAAYRRTDLFERRRELMQGWSDYLKVD